MHQIPSNKKSTESIEVEAKTKTVKSVPAVDFTEGELDTMLSSDAIDQELKRMHSKGVLPSQKIQLITADTVPIVEAVRWQETKEKELKDMQIADTKKEQPWTQDLAEDFVTFGLSPANTKEEAKIILENLDKNLEEQADAGFGPDARNWINQVRKELELIIEKL